MKAEPFSRRYIDAAIANTRQRIASTPANLGLRNKTLNRETFCLARLIGPNLSEQEVIEVAVSGATANGYIGDHGMKAVMATINGAIREGKKLPQAPKPQCNRRQA